MKFPRKNLIRFLDSQVKCAYTDNFINKSKYFDKLRRLFQKLKKKLLKVKV